jgi:hypothetical protein
VTKDTRQEFGDFQQIVAKSNITATLPYLGNQRSRSDVQAGSGEG